MAEGVLDSGEVSIRGRLPWPLQVGTNLAEGLGLKQVRRFAEGNFGSAVGRTNKAAVVAAAGNGRRQAALAGSQHAVEGKFAKKLIVL